MHDTVIERADPDQGSTLAQAAHAAAAAQRLAAKTLAIYSLPYMSYWIVALPLTLFVPSYYADELGIPLAAVGAAIAGSRLIDVITDPFIGYLTDRSRSPWGRRKPWIAAGTPLLMLSVWMVLVPGPAASFGYLMLWTTLLYLGFTLVDLSYKAWGAELSSDYSERSRVTGWREGFGFGGQLLFVAIVLVMERSGYTHIEEQMQVIAATVLVTLPPLLVWAFCKVDDPPPEQLSGEQASGIAGLRLLACNPAFIRIIVAVVLFVAGIVIQATLHRLVMTHVTDSPGIFVTMLLLENIVTIAAVPLGLHLSYRMDKHRALALAALWAGLWSLPLPLIGPGDGWWLVGLLVIRGASFATILFLANSIAADVVDQDTVDSGRQRTGLFFALWAMIYKLAIAVGVLLATVLPAWSGFEPSQGGLSDSAEQALMLVYGWLPSLLMGLSALCLWTFPIDAARQQALRALIVQRVINKR